MKFLLSPIGGIKDALLATGAPFNRRLAIVMLLAQGVAAAMAVATHLMLYGDGAYFAFTVALQDAWRLKWAAVADRATIYALAMAPTELIASRLTLTPLQVGDVTALLFHGVPIVQFCACCLMSWRARASLMIFPLVQFVISFSAVYGFPSEIVFAPGFLWICILSLESGAAGAGFVLSFLGLVFCHELAFVSAALVYGMVWTDLFGFDTTPAGRRRRRLLLIAMTIILTAFLVAFFSGGAAGSQSNAIYVVDPRRILISPTLGFVVSAAALAYAATFQLGDGPRGGAAVAGCVLVAGFGPLIVKWLAPDVDFGLGRYEAGRTLVAASMVILVLAFWRAKADGPATPLSPRRAKAVQVSLVAALACGAGCGTGFLMDWTSSMASLHTVVTDTRPGSGGRFISVDVALARLSARDAKAFSRIDYFWALPYRSIMAADGAAPAHIVFGQNDYHAFCRLRSGGTSSGLAIPAATLASLDAFACAYKAPPPRHDMRDRLEAVLRRLAAFLRRRPG